MKKLLAMILSVILVLSCVSFASAEAKTFKIGICNFVDDASLNQIIENIKAELEDISAATGCVFEIEEDNCNMDFNLLDQIIANFIADKVNLMIGVATPVATRMQSMTADNQIPVVFAAVSDPLSVGLVDSLEAPGANITGTSDFLNTDAMMNLMLAMLPEAKTVGLLYDLGQDSSTTPIAAAKAFLTDKGISFIEANGTTAEEVMLAAQSLSFDKVDAVFTPTDNTIMSAELSIYEIFADARIPHFTGADSFALNGAFLGYGVDYAKLGRETGKMAADILVNEKNPGEVPVMLFDNGTATINTETCDAIGLDFDTVADLIAPYCIEIKTIVTAENFSDLQ